MNPYSGYQSGNFPGQFNPNELYDPQGAYKRKELTTKTHIGPEEMKEIVERLNAKPFNENYTLVTFDELNPYELLELLNKVVGTIDSAQEVPNLRSEDPSKTGERISEFLRVMNYPSNFDVQFQQAIINGDKKTIHPILYYLLQRLPDLQKRAYLAKFLVPLHVPEEMLADDEMKNLYQEYKDLQAEFQVNHQQLEAVQKDSLNPNEIKKEIAQLEQEKEQLNTRINMFKTKHGNKPEFKTLLEATNLLRREQEEEARLSEKYRTQRQQLEWTDQQLLSAQQRLIDAKKSLSVDNTAEQMLQGLRLEVKKNRDLCNERLAIEIMEKRKKLEQVEHLLAEPPVSASEISKLENGIVTLRRTVQQLEEKLKTEVNPDEDKLAIYKQQANLVAKKKEQKMEELKKTEEEKERMEKKIKEKEAEIYKLKGPGYKSKDSFKQYAANLREKTNKFKKMKDELREIKNEIGILTRTEQIVRANKEEYERELRRKEAERGVAGATSTKEGLEKVSEKKHEVDIQKGKTLEEISKIVQQLEAKFKEKKETLRPKMNELKELRERFKTLEKTYLVKKAEYDQTIAGIESENASLEAEVKKIKDEVYADDTKLTKLKYQAQIIELMNQRLNDENDYLHGRKEFSKEFKSYRDMLQAGIKRQENDIKNLKKEREAVKENYEPSLRQTNMLTDLKKLLALKIQVAKNEGGRRDFEPRNETTQGNVNRLVVRE